MGVLVTRELFASGAFNAMRQLGGVFGVAILAASFSASGGYASPQSFNDGFTAAVTLAAGLSLAGALAGAVLPSRRAANEVPAASASPARA